METLKAYPLIYSRTKNSDFMANFLTRPKDLNVNAALDFVNSAMSNLDGLNLIRYTAFRTGDYCICGGIACVSKILVEKLLKSFSADEYNDAKNYLQDEKGRYMSCFIGLAFKKAEVPIDKIPVVNLKTYWNTYLLHLKKQWDKSVPTTEEIGSERIEEFDVELKTYDKKKIQPDFNIAGKGLIRKSKHDDIQWILDYYFYRILHQNSSESVISDIQTVDEFHKTTFKNAVVDDKLFDELQNPVNMKNTFIKHDGMNSYARSLHFKSNDGISYIDADLLKINGSPSKTTANDIFLYKSLSNKGSNTAISKAYEFLNDEDDIGKSSEKKNILTLAARIARIARIATMATMATIARIATIVILLIIIIMLMVKIPVENSEENSEENPVENPVETLVEAPTN